MSSFDYNTSSAADQTRALVQEQKGFSLPSMVVPRAVIRVLGKGAVSFYEGFWFNLFGLPLIGTAIAFITTVSFVINPAFALSPWWIPVSLIGTVPWICRLAKWSAMKFKASVEKEASLLRAQTTQRPK